LTSIPSTGPDDFTVYPSEWHTWDYHLGIEVRHLEPDKYQLKSKTHLLTISKEGFDLYRDRTESGRVIFDDWCIRHGILATLRIDDDDES
jgi:hypothetical protein